MGNPNVSFDFNDLERPSSGSLIYFNPYILQGEEVGHMLLLNTNRKSYIGIQQYYLIPVRMSLVGQIHVQGSP